MMMKGRVIEIRPIESDEPEYKALLEVILCPENNQEENRASKYEI